MMVSSFFRESQPKQALPTDSQSARANPYLDARREWNERYGSYLTAAAHWRAIAFGAIGLSIISVSGIAYIGAQSKFVPFVVRVDKLGQAVPVTALRPAPTHDVRVIVAQLARWVFEVRSVFHDPSAEHALLSRAYASVSPDSPAFGELNTYLRRNNPFRLGDGEDVDVTINDVLPISRRLYRITWTEQTRTRHLGTMAVTHWAAVLTIKIRPPTTSAEILQNPMGVYITNFSWSQSLT